MKKMKLQLDTLRVSTFPTDPKTADERGAERDFFAPTQANTCVTCTRHTDPCLCFPTP